MLGRANIIELDLGSSAPGQPYGIVTADGHSPFEIDDGLWVQELPANEELYRVGVCSVDTSGLYNDRDVVNQVLTRTQTRYREESTSGSGCDPMLSREMVDDLHFRQGKERSALMVSFTIGANVPPTDVDVSFGTVKVDKNLTYKNFGAKCRYSDRMWGFGRASAFIMHHLRYNSGGDEDVLRSDSHDGLHRRIIHVPPAEAWKRGARLNEAFMIAAGHLVAELMVAENRPAIYRVHNPDDEAFLEFLPPNVARYSQNPGPHIGLGLEPYSRVTSPLRRAEDFVMLHLLRQRHLGQTATMSDLRDIAVAVQRLNQGIVSSVMHGPLKMQPKDSLGTRQRARDVVEEVSTVRTLRPVRSLGAAAVA